VKLYHTPGRGKTAGVTIVVGPNCNFLDDLVQVKNNVQDESGRILRIDFNMLGTPSTLIGAYCPAQTEERDFFFSELLPSSLPPPGARQVLLAGDFNCVFSEETDVFYPPGHPGLRQGSSRLHGSAGLGRLMQDHSLVDIWRDQHPADLTFTHWSKASNSGARLDRWLLSPGVLTMFERSWSQVLSSSAIHTDHLPAILSFAMPKDCLKQGRGVLAFPLLLLNLPSAAEILRSAVQAEAACLFSISHPGRLAVQWNEAKARILLLSHRLHRDHKKALRSATVVKENQAQAQMHALLTNMDPMQHNGLLGSFLTTSDLVFKAWADQCSPLLDALRSLDHIFGDTSSFYFHSLRREYQPPLTLTSLNRPGRQEGEDLGTADLHTVQGKRKALQYATDFFSASSAIGVFRQRQVEEERQDDFLSNTYRKLSEDQQVLAEGPDENGLLTEDELLLALNSTGRGACPGYDGLPYEFYRAFREDLVPLLLHIFNTAFLASTYPSSPSLSPLLCGVICLLPKPGQPQCELSGLRPITLLNCDSKLVLLMLSNRLQRPLDYLVDIAQSAFIHGRDISDNVRYHQGLRSRLKELGTPAHLLLSDLTKAYDSVDRGLVLRAMSAQGFREQGIIRWVQLMSSGTSCTVRINGTFTPFFPTVSGLEQGSSLSCHKWVIVWQLFFAQLNKLQASGTLPTFPLPNGENAPPSLGYADDDNYILIGELSELALKIKRLFEEGAKLGLPEQSTTKTFLLCLSDDTHPVIQMGRDTSINPPPCYPQLPQEKIAGLRHLGVPLFGLHEENCRQAFSKVPGTMRLEGLAWNCAQPNKLGRTHISVLNLASKAIYQAAFHKPPANLVAAMQQQVNRFVAKPSCSTEDSPIPTQLYPSANMCFLPKKAGGLSLPDLNSHFTAMRAKPCWKMFVRSVHPWQQLFRHEVTKAGPAEAFGADWVVRNPLLVHFHRIPTLPFRDAVEAFSLLNMRRLHSPEEMDPYAVLLEPLLDNPDIRLSNRLQVLVSTRGWKRLKDLRTEYHLHSVHSHHVFAVIQALPNAWQTILTQHDFQEPEWSVITSSQEKQVLLKGPQTEDPYWEALPTGAMIPYSGEVINLATPPRAALVQYYPKPAYAWSREDWNFHKAQQNLAVADRQRVLEPRLLGIWDEMDLDPRGWGFRREHHEDSETNAPESAEERHQVTGAGQGNVGCVDINLVDMTVREARKALTHQATKRRSHSAHSRLTGLAELGALWPALWSVNPLQHTPPPTASESQLRLYGLEGLEERWKQPLGDDHFPPEELDQLPAWMRPGASSRRNQHASPSTAPLAARKEAKDVWQRLLDPTLHRPFAITCWHLNHGVLGCNAFLWHIRRKTANTRTSQLQQVQHTLTNPYCEVPSCRLTGKHEDLTHAFLECPEVTPVIDWLLDTWKKLLSPFPDLVQWAIVPRSKTIIIADDPHGWSSTHPPRQLMKNWTRLRVAVIGAIWFTRCQRKDLPIHQHSFASQAIALAASSLTDAIRRDWLRTTQDLRTLDNGFTCADWLRGHAAIQRYSSFEKSWLSPPIFCSVTAEDTSKRLSLHIPAPPFPATVRIDQPLDPTLLPSPALLPRFIIPPRTGQGDQGPTPALLPGLNTAPRTGQGGQAPHTTLRNRLFASHDHEAGPSGLSLAEKLMIA